MQVRQGNHQDCRRLEVVNHSVRKPAQSVSPQFRANCPPGKRMTLNSLQPRCHLKSKVLSEAAARGLVVGNGIVEFSRRNFEEANLHFYRGFLRTCSASITCSSPRR